VCRVVKTPILTSSTWGTGFKVFASCGYPKNSIRRSAWQVQTANQLRRGGREAPAITMIQSPKFHYTWTPARSSISRVSPLAPLRQQCITIARSANSLKSTPLYSNSMSMNLLKRTASYSNRKDSVQVGRIPTLFATGIGPEVSRRQSLSLLGYPNKSTTWLTHKKTYLQLQQPPLKKDNQRMRGVHCLRSIGQPSQQGLGVCVPAAPKQTKKLIRHLLNHKAAGLGAP
jgi:hypothetical protein